MRLSSRIAYLTVVTLLIASPCYAQRIHIDYDEDADFSAYKTFAWSETEETSVERTDPLIHSQIKTAIEYHLTHRGLIEVESKPDIYVTYHASSTEELMLNASHFGYDYGTGWHLDPTWNWGASSGTSTADANTFTEGTLIVDIWDAATATLIFRGSATTGVSDNSKKNEKRIGGALSKMARRFDKMLRKNRTGP